MKSSLKVLLLASGLLLTGRSAQAQINADWTGTANPPDNQFSTGSNWSGGQVPTATATIDTTATINLPGVATTLTGDVIVTGTTVLINASTAGFTTQTLQVNSGGVLTLNIPSSGTFTIAASFPTSFIGGLRDGSSGVLNITGGGTLFLPAGTDDFGVGQGGVGTVNLTSGFFDDTTGLYIGGDAGVVGNSNSTSTGTGVFTISGTSTLTAANIFLAPGSTTATGTSTGTLNINGGVVTTTDLIMGANLSSNPPGNPANPNGPISNTTGVINQTAGSLTVTELVIAANPGAVDSYSLGGTGTFVGNTVTVGSLAGASGTFSQSGSSTATITTLNVGQSGQGTADLQGGTLTILTNGALNVGNQAGGTGTFTQSGGQLTLAGTSQLNIGNSGNGGYTLSGGTITIGALGGMNIGTDTGNGTFTLSGSGVLATAAEVFVGGSTGTGVFNLDGGTLNNTAIVSISTNGTFNQNANFTPNPAHQIVIFPGGVYNLNSGTLTIGGDVTGGTSGISGGTGSILNFNGGTVATTSTAFLDELNGAVGGNVTFDTTLSNATLTGTLTGGGMLTVTGGGTLDITGSASSTSSWGIDAQNGTISATAANFPSTGGMITEANGTIEMADSGFHALSGSVSGAGNFNVNFAATTDTLELTGPISLTGQTTLTGGGTLQVLTGSFQDIGSAGNLLIGDGTSGGTVNINGIASYSGNTTISAGSTLFANDITSTGTVTNNGTFGSNGTISSTLNTPTTTISGSYAASTGTLLIRMATVGNVVNADLFAFTGTADVTGTTFSLVNPIAMTGTLTILTSGGLTGAGAIIQPSSNLFVHDRIVVDTVNPNDLDLVSSVSTSSSIPGLNLTPNQSAVAMTLDQIITNTSNLTPSQLTGFSALLNQIGASGTSASQLALNYEQLTPESLQYAQAIAYEHSAFLVSKVDGFDNALHHEFSGFDTSGVSIVLPGFNSAMGRQMQSMLAYHDTAPNGVNYYPGTDDTPTTATIDTSSSPVSSHVMSDSATTAPMPVRSSHAMTIRKPYSNFSAFIGGDGTLANLNQDQGASYAPSSKASYTSVDAIVGISYRMTSNLAAGILFNYSNTDADTDSYGSKTRVNTYSPGVFATYGEKGFYINGLFSYGLNNYSNSRAIPVIGSIANSNPDGNQYTAALDAGQELHLGDDWTITPQGGLTYTHLDIDSFTESGAEPANLSVQAQHDDSLRSRLGASVGYTTFAGHLTLLPTFTAMWQHEFMDENAPITSSFSDFSSGAFTIHSVSMGRDSALIGIGLTAQLDNTMAIFFECNADVNANYNAENIVGGFKGSF